MLPDPIASVLRVNRDSYNARFALARRRWPELAADDFGFFLETFAAPLVSAAEAARPGSAVTVSESAYDIGLELIGQRLAGSLARDNAINNLWSQMLPKLATHVAAAPTRVLPALCNAAHQVATTPGANVLYWMTMLAELGPRCDGVDALLRLGQVLAWRAGLAHFRAGALAAANALPEALALAAVGASASASWREIQTRLAADPWFDPRDAASARPMQPMLAARVGAFRGFGGLFLEPPRVNAHGEHFVVRASDGIWVLVADIFGATFHRANTDSAKTPPPLPTSTSTSTSTPAAPRNIDLSDLGPITSGAQIGATLALTGTLTHSVVLIALPNA